MTRSGTERRREGESRTEWAARRARGAYARTRRWEAVADAAHRLGATDVGAFARLRASVEYATAKRLYALADATAQDDDASLPTDHPAMVEHAAAVAAFHALPELAQAVTLTDAEAAVGLYGRGDR